MTTFRLATPLERFDLFLDAPADRVSLAERQALSELVLGELAEGDHLDIDDARFDFPPAENVAAGAEPPFSEYELVVLCDADRLQQTDGQLAPSCGNFGQPY